MPPSALAVPTFLMFSKLGLTNTPWAVIIPSLIVPFGLYLMWTFAAGAIPTELLEAARVDGASEFRTFFRICVPLLAPGIVTVLLFIPYVLLLVHSFWRLRGGGIVHEFTLENYRRLFGTALYPHTILFSAGIALRVTIFSLLLAYPLAYLLAFKVKRHRNLMYMAVIIPLWVSYLVRAYAWKIILGQEGILNGLLQAAGLIHEPLTFLLARPARTS